METVIQWTIVFIFLAAATYYVAADTDAPFCFAAATTIITSSRLLDTPRAFLSRLTDRGGDRLNFFDELLTCDLCVSTWVGALIAGAAVAWLGLSAWDAALAGPGIMFAT